MKFRDLPREPRLQIASLLSGPDLVALSRVSNRFRAMLIKHVNMMWFETLRIHSAAPGVLKNPSPVDMISSNGLFSETRRDPTTRLFINYDCEIDYRKIALDYVSGDIRRTSKYKSNRCMYCFRTVEDIAMEESDDTITAHVFEKATGRNKKGYITFTRIYCTSCEKAKTIVLAPNALAAWDTYILHLPFTRYKETDESDNYEALPGKFRHVYFVHEIIEAYRTANHRGSFEQSLEYGRSSFECWAEYIKENIFKLILDYFEESVLFTKERMLLDRRQVRIYLRAIWNKVWSYNESAEDWRFIECGLILRDPYPLSFGGSWSEFTNACSSYRHNENNAAIWRRKVALRILQHIMLSSNNEGTRRRFGVFYSGDKPTLPLCPIIPAIWRASARNFQPEQREFVGECAHGCSDGFCYSQFQYAVHVYLNHEDRFFEEDAMVWRHARDPMILALPIMKPKSRNDLNGVKPDSESSGLIPQTTNMETRAVANVNFHDFYCELGEGNKIRGALLLHNTRLDRVHDYHVERSDV